MSVLFPVTPEPESDLSLRFPVLLVGQHFPDFLGELQVGVEQPVLVLLQLPPVHLQLLDLPGGLLHHLVVVVGEAPDLGGGDGGAAGQAADTAGPAEVAVAQTEVADRLGEEAGAKSDAGAVLGLVRLLLVLHHGRLLDLHLGVRGRGRSATAGDAHSGVAHHTKTMLSPSEICGPITGHIIHQLCQ